MACNLLKKLVGLGRLELPTRGLGNRRSIHPELWVSNLLV